MSVRLNKLLAQAGLGARRKCDALVQSGAVRVNGAVVLEPGTAIEPDRDRVEVHGRPLPPRNQPVYFAFHKPIGVISTMSDPEGRATLRDFQPPGARVFPVGRLDADTSGLLILTNDGELAHHLMHPRYGVTKLYRVHADRAPSPEMLHRLREGIEFEPGVKSAPARVRVRDETPGASVLELELHEGRYRQVRRMCEAAGLRVLRLHRWGYGPLRLSGLERGLWRELSEEEVRRLRAASARPQARPRGAALESPRQRREEWRPSAAPDEMRSTPFRRGPQRRSVSDGRRTHRDRAERSPGRPGPDRERGRARKGEPARGRRRSEPDRGTRGHQPDRGRRRSEPDRGQRGHQPVRGRRRSEPDRGTRGHQPDPGRRRSEPDRGTRGHQPGRGRRRDESGRGPANRAGRQSPRGRSATGPGRRGRRPSPLRGGRRRPG